MSARRPPVGSLMLLALSPLVLLGAGPPDVESPEAAPAAPEAATPVDPPGDDTAIAPVVISPEDPALPIEAAWFAPAATLGERVLRTRRAALEQGVWNFDAAARALLSGHFGGDPVELADAAVRLAPDLPAARFERARAQWLHGDAPIAALRTALSALLAIPRHTEASLWFGGTALYILAVTLVVGGLACVMIAGLFAVPHAAHDLGDLVAEVIPGFARFALIAVIVLVPLVLGEGLLGVGLVLLAVGLLYASGRKRAVLAVAAAAVALGAHVVAPLAGATLTLWSADPVVEAAFSSAQGFTLPADVARLEAAAGDDELAARALAQWARREGNLGQADAYYQALLERHPDDAVLLNNAANVRLALGHMESALELYRAAAESVDSPIVLFNLSQAHGHAFQVEDLGEALALAQQLDGNLLAELTQLQGTQPEGFVVDLPLPAALAWRRALVSPEAEPFAAEFRAAFAPGRLGRDPRLAAGALALVLLAGVLGGGALRPSHWCSSCGRTLCPRCDAGFAGEEVCEDCAHLYDQRESLDRALRTARIAALRLRERRINHAVWLTSLLVPGAAGLLADRPLRGLLGALLFGLACTAALWRGGVAPDPFVAGEAAPFGFLGVAGLAVLGYAALVATSLATRRER